MDSDDRRVRHEVFRSVLEDCHFPSVQEIAHQTSLSDDNVKSALKNLHDLHHLQLYNADVPTMTPIAMLHPFSHIPTPYIVRTADKLWFANCAWCAFGLAAMLSPAEVSIRVLLSSSGDHLAFTVANGTVTKAGGSAGSLPLEDVYTVFSAPPSQLWKDVRFACSGIQICTSKVEAESWHSRHAFPYGDVVPLDKLWELSKAWYSDKASFGYDRKTPQEAAELFHNIGLDPRYWTS